MASVNADHVWEVVLNRDRHGDGRFVYAVSSTGVYCRPSCPSRRPARRQGRFSIRRTWVSRRDIAPVFAAGLSRFMVPRWSSGLNKPDAIWMGMRTSPSPFRPAVQVGLSPFPTEFQYCDSETDKY
jgi:metal binding Ada-like protein